jgi:hypothetical protein
MPPPRPSSPPTAPLREGQPGSIPRVLFDLQSPRRRVVVKFVYGGLALLIGGGLILGTFGSSGGGLLDSIGLGGGSSSNSGFEDQINSAQDKVTANPNDPAARLALARAHFLAGNTELNANADPNTGQSTPTTEAIQEFQRAADAWDAYLKLNPPQPSSNVAVLMAQSYLTLAQTATSAAEADSDIKGAAKAQQIVVDAKPSQGAYTNLAIYLYFSGDTAGGDAAAAKAAAAAGPAAGTQLTAQLDKLKAAAAKFRKQVDAALKPATGAQGGQAAPAPGAPGTTNPFSNPLQSSPSAGGLGG